jgi:hypothetical protein
MGRLLLVTLVALLVLGVFGVYTVVIYKAGQYKERQLRERWSQIIDAALEWRKVELQTGVDSVTSASMLRDLRLLVDQEEDKLSRELRKLTE